MTEEKNQNVSLNIKPDRTEESDLRKTGESGLRDAVRWYVTLANWLIRCDPWISALKVLEQLVNRGPLRSAEQVLWIFGGTSNFRNVVRNMGIRRAWEGGSAMLVDTGGDLPFHFNLREVDDELLIRNPNIEICRWISMEESDHMPETAGGENMECMAD